MSMNHVPRSIRRMFPEVTHAVDAKKSIEVHVNKQDCSKATKLDPTGCAMARAIKREFHADGVIIGISTSYLIKGKKAIRYATPQRVAREIVSFDRHKDFAAGSYTLSKRSPTLRFDADNRKRDGKRRGRHDKADKKRVMHKNARVRELPKG